MKDDGLILAAWAEAAAQRIPAILATVVKVSGSAYRSPGARMLVTENGGRTGSISGGCLESDILKKAWWLTADRGVSIQVYDNTSEEDAIWEFGLGCNGIVHVLLERWNAGADPLTVKLLTACRVARQPGVLATLIAGQEFGAKLAVFPDGTHVTDITDGFLYDVILAHARAVSEKRESSVETLGNSEVFLEFVPPPVSLLVVGAGHDALPVVAFAKELGWHVTVVDGRSHFARPERFPLADRVVTADLDDPLHGLPIDSQTAAVLMSHSYEQDTAFLRALGDVPLRYLGVLGPRKRTDRMLAEAGALPRPDLHSPVGLDIGADSPEEIALAIVSEIQATLTQRPGAMLFRRSGPIHAGRTALGLTQTTIG